MLDRPEVAWHAEHAATTIGVRFVVRGPDGLPLGPSDVDVRPLLDGHALDAESASEVSAHARGYNLFYTLVLDATRSLLAPPPAFEPMKLAAQSSIRQARQVMSQQPGRFAWDVKWFDDFVYRSVGSWSDEAIASIPAPTGQMDFTRLYAAVAFSIDDLPRALQAANMPDSHTVMVIFSDGQDNHSWWSGEPSSEVIDQGSQSYEKVGGWPSVDLDALLAKVRATPNITLHTIGMGAEVDDQALSRLAEAGQGIYVKGAQRSSVAGLFDRVSREFTTIQSISVTVPNAPGDYAFSVEVRGHAGGDATLTFQVHVGDATAAPLL